MLVLFLYLTFIIPSSAFRSTFIDFPLYLYLYSLFFYIPINFSFPFHRYFLNFISSIPLKETLWQIKEQYIIIKLNWYILKLF
jgi:hypothetical protein